MPSDFNGWLAQLAVGVGPSDHLLGPACRAWLPEVFNEWGPLSVADLHQLSEMDRERIMSLEMEAARSHIAALVADAWTVGMTLEVALNYDGIGGLVVSAAPEAGSRYYSSSNPERMWPVASDADLLAWLANEVQEATMERDQVHCFVWPTCQVHQLGGHAVVEQGTAVWHCNGGGGHVLARIGELDGRPTHAR